MVCFTYITVNTLHKGDKKHHHRCRHCKVVVVVVVAATAGLAVDVGVE